MEPASEQPAQSTAAASMAADNAQRDSSPPRDKKRKLDDGNHDRRRGKGKQLQHGSHPTKKRSMGRKEHL